MKKYLPFFICPILFFLSCDPKKNAQDSIAITGITARSTDGSNVGNIDADDWTNDSSWPDFIQEKFNFTDSFDYYFESQKSTFPSLICFPNPCSTNCYFSIESSNQTIMKYILVDETSLVYQQGTVKLSASHNMFQFLLPDSQYPRNKYYRLYYAMYDQNKNIYYKGHGDIKKNPK